MSTALCRVLEESVIHSAPLCTRSLRGVHRGFQDDVDGGSSDVRIAKAQRHVRASQAPLLMCDSKLMRVVPVATTLSRPLCLACQHGQVIRPTARPCDNRAHCGRYRKARRHAFVVHRAQTLHAVWAYDTTITSLRYHKRLPRMNSRSPPATVGTLG